MKKILLALLFSITGLHLRAQMQIQTILIDSGIYVKDINVLSADTVVFCVGNKIIRTNNGGLSWDTLYPYPSFNQADFYDYYHGMVVSIASGIVRTNNAGITWDTIQNIPASNYNDIKMLDSVNAIVSTDSGYIMHLSDTGYYNDTIVDSLAGGMPVVVKDFFFLDDMRGFGGGGVSAFSALIYTSDSGLTWGVRATSGFLDLFFDEIAFVNDLVGWAIEDSPSPWEHIAYTLDGGFTWNSGLPYFSTAKFNSIDFTSSGVGLAAGKSGFIYGTTDSGQSWDTIYVIQPGGAYTVKIKVVNDTLAYLGGWHGIYKLTNFTTGLSEVLPKDNKIFKVFPTLFQNEIVIESLSTLQDDLKFECFNIFGEKVYSFIIKDKLQRQNLSFLNSGVYLLKATNSQHSGVVKIVKQ